jgi:hypothetical protein
MRTREPRTFTVLVCPICGATSTDHHPRYSAGELWSSAGTCHLGPTAVEPVLYVPLP